jgi:hypothetical protein
MLLIRNLKTNIKISKIYHVSRYVLELSHFGISLLKRSSTYNVIKLYNPSSPFKSNKHTRK